ncbi:MAG: hypothetical protein R3E88_19720 [Myxococcota bacterium]|nr:hypothetical protein [Myxococcales bacterium]
MPIPNRPRRSRACGLLAVVLALATAGPAAASPQTLVRGLSNIALAPLDAALAPISSFVGIRENLQNIDDSPGVRRFYPIPAWFYAVGLQLGCSVIRAATGAIEVIPGIPLVFVETDMEPLFDPVTDASALFEFDSDILDDGYRFGINYTQPGF